MLTLLECLPRAWDLDSGRDVQREQREISSANRAIAGLGRANKATESQAFGSWGWSWAGSSVAPDDQ